MDRRVVEAVRLALFGRMVMGVAHEIDNHLSVVMGFSELLQLAGTGAKKAGDHAVKIFSAAEKIGAIVKQFAYYVRPHAPSVEPFPPGDLVREIVPFSRYDLGRGGITLAVSEDIPSGLIATDRRDLALALLALLFNGSEAMAGKGGAIRLGVSRAGGGWEFAVADEGPGIPPEIMPRIFEEGFTTKPEPFHSGMGLPVARHLAEGMGGAVTVENLPAGGCLAMLRLPDRWP